jgi:hypothetical protein
MKLATFSARGAVAEIDCADVERQTVLPQRAYIELSAAGHNMHTWTNA